MPLARLTCSVLLAASSPCMAQASDRFEWPEINTNVLPDARLGPVVTSAKQAARQGADRAWEGRKISMQAKVRISLRGAIGLGGKPTIIDAGTVMKAVPYNGDSGPMLGAVSYASGASMTGIFGPDIGIYHASMTSSIAEFAGWCYGATTSNPQPTDGEYHLRSGDTFVGTRHADQYEGVYESADHTRKFIGTVLLNTASPRPIRGVVEGDHGQLLAVINPTA